MARVDDNAEIKKNSDDNNDDDDLKRAKACASRLGLANSSNDPVPTSDYIRRETIANEECGK